MLALSTEHTALAIALPAMLATMLTAGYFAQAHPSNTARNATILLTIPFIALAYYLAANGPPIGTMVGVILPLLYGLKTLIAINDKARLSPTQWTAFAIGWFGMRPIAFRKLGKIPLDGYERLIAKGLTKIAVGSLLIAAAWAITTFPTLDTFPTFKRTAVIALLLPGLSLVLHFGIFNVLTGLWRVKGVPVHTLFKAPLKAKTLKEFWGHRWNTAFVEMTANLIFRPMKVKFGYNLAHTFVFLFSGLVHELAISVPARSGYGLPTLYFVTQAIGIHIENRLSISGKIWTSLWILLPLPFLFHAEFLNKIILPIVGYK